jgi:PAS domain-containing protein
METGATADLTLARKAAEGGEVARLLGRTCKATESLLSRARVAFREALARLEKETDIAVAGALVALVCLIVLSLLRQTVTAETGETRRSVEATLAQIEALQPASLDDAAFLEAIIQAGEAPYVAVVWLFTLDGRIVQGNRAFSQGTVETSVTGERAWVWGVFVLLGNLVALITYILARRPHLQTASANPGLAEAGNRHP